jgi:hypothetical protein
MPKKTFDVGIELNISDLVKTSGAGKEMLDALNGDGDFVGKQVYWELEIERDKDWNKKEIRQVKDGILSIFNAQYGSKLVANSRFFVREAKGELDV